VALAGRSRLAVLLPRAFSLVIFGIYFSYSNAFFFFLWFIFSIFLAIPTLFRDGGSELQAGRSGQGKGKRARRWWRWLKGWKAGAGL
jgi:hypothetical protein